MCMFLHRTYFQVWCTNFFRSDEQNCTCSEDQFQCVNGYDRRNEDNCISKKSVCDGSLDCSDGSDEVNCNYVCKEDEFKCLNGTIGRPPFFGYCIRKHEVCDGYLDCRDKSDEADCHLRCPEGKFRCANGLDSCGWAGASWIRRKPITERPLPLPRWPVREL